MKDKVNQQIALEKQILGSCLVNDGVATVAVGILSENSFIDKKNAKLFKTIKSIVNSNGSVGYITHQSHFDSYARELFINFNDLYTDKYMLSACMTLKECEIERELELTYRKIKDLDGSIYDKINELEVKLSELNYSYKNQLFNINELVKKFESYINKINAGNLGKVYTGISNIDDEFGAYMPAELTIIGARTSIGKTAFALSAIYNQMRQNKKVLMFSREMSVEQIMLRLYSMFSEDSLYSLRRAEKYSEAMLTKFKVFNDLIKQYNFNLDLYSNNEVLIYNRIKSMKESGLDVVYIDYLGLLNATGKHQNRNYEIGAITAKLKQASVDFDVPIICLAQINREGDDLAKPPSLKHLRDSGSVENDADIVAFLHRPNKNKPGKIEQANYIVAKMRQGVTGQVTINFIRDLAMFKSYEQKEF